MSRALPAAVETALQQTRLREEVLVFFDFDSGEVRFWSGVGDLTIARGTDADGTYTGSGNLGSVGPIKESTGMEATGREYTLSGIPTELVSIALGEHYQGRACKMWLAYFDVETNALIGAPVRVASDRLNLMSIVEGGDTASIAVTAESKLIDMSRPHNPLYYTDEDQRGLFAGDRGFEFVPAMQEATILWGKTTLQPGVAGDAPSEPSTGGLGSRADWYDRDDGTHMDDGDHGLDDNDNTSGGGGDPAPDPGHGFA